MTVQNMKSIRVTNVGGISRISLYDDVSDFEKHQEFNFINSFTLCAKLLRLKKASQKLGAERKSLAQSINGFMTSTPGITAILKPVLNTSCFSFLPFFSFTHLFLQRKGFTKIKPRKLIGAKFGLNK